MYQHPYEHDQKAFAHWLDHTEKVTFRPLPRSEKVPSWSLLDSIVKFVTASVVEGNGWMADSWREIVLFHWLQGDSDGSGASGQWLRESDMYTQYFEGLGNTTERTGITGESLECETAHSGSYHAEVCFRYSESMPDNRVMATRFPESSYLLQQRQFDMLDIFLGEDPLISADSMKIRALEASRNFERNILLREDQNCGVIAERVDEHEELKSNIADADQLIL